METLTLEISSPIILDALANAARQGVPAQSYLLDLVETSLLSQRSFEELAEPMAQGFDAGDLSEDELDALIEQERQAVWNEKHGRQ